MTIRDSGYNRECIVDMFAQQYQQLPNEIMTGLSLSFSDCQGVGYSGMTSENLAGWKEVATKVCQCSGK